MEIHPDTATNVMAKQTKGSDNSSAKSDNLYLTNNQRFLKGVGR
jgi:hypothetical protein